MKTRVFYGGERCAHCGLAFVKMVPGQRYCGRKCKDRHLAAERKLAQRGGQAPKVNDPCKVCGKAFSRTDRGNVTQVYCSDQCRADRRKGEAKTTECSQCKQPFPAFGRQKRCRSCLAEGTKKQKSCQICGRGFVTHTDAQRHCGSCRALDNETQAMMRERISVRPGQAYTMAEIVARNIQAGPLEGCARCKRREGHDVWCPIGGES